MAKQPLHNKYVKFQLAIPIMLHFMCKGKKRKFDIASEAVRFIEQQITDGE